VTPSIINTADAPEYRKPWKFEMVEDAAGKRVQFELIPEPDPVIPYEPIPEGEEVITPPFHDLRIGLREYDLHDQGDAREFISISTDRDANDHYYIQYKFARPVSYGGHKIVTSNLSQDNDPKHWKVYVDIVDRETG